jgi:hypothetical protein
MKLLDLGNTFFIFGGCFFIWRNVLKLYRDKMVRGASIEAGAFFTLWSVWQLVYYSGNQHWVSFAAGIIFFAGDLAWVVLAVLYTRGEQNGRSCCSKA